MTYDLILPFGESMRAQHKVRRFRRHALRRFSR